MINFCTIYLARPGPTRENVRLPPTRENPNGSWSQSDDASLNEQGIADACKIADEFKDIHFDSCYTSKALRTIETANLILKNSQFNQAVETRVLDALYEMRLLEIEGEDGITEAQMKEIFCAATKYPSEESKIICPRVWAKRNGGDVEPNDVYLDRWNQSIDNFEDFSAERVSVIKAFAKEHLGETIAFIPHGTPFKALIAEAVTSRDCIVTSDSVKVARGAIACIRIYDNGKFQLLMKKSVSYPGCLV